MSEATSKEKKLQNFIEGALSDDATRAAVHARLAIEHIEKSQAFFAELAASVIPPHVDDRWRKSVQDLLLRATERGLYAPEAK